MTEGKFHKFSRAQTALELAIFGAILIFVLGLIVKQALSTSYLQNQYLKALRLAMRLSFEYSEGIKPVVEVNGVQQRYSGEGVASRNTANVLFIEDRLTAGAEKYGTIDRAPQVINVSATDSRNLFLPLKGYLNPDLPVFDAFVNGQHFPFTVGGFKTICLEEKEEDCEKYKNKYPDIKFYDSDLVPWEDKCVTYSHWERENPADDLSPETEIVDVFGCKRFYTRVPNSPSDNRWCNGDASAQPCCDCTPEALPDQRWCAGATAAGNYRIPCNMPADDRFNLDHQGGIVVPAGERAAFSWQWYKVMAFDEYESAKSYQAERQGYDDYASTNTNGVCGDIPDDPDCAPGLELNQAEGINLEEEENQTKNVEVDVDGDLKEETILDILAENRTTFVIKVINVFDPNEGDLDFSYNTNDKNAGVPQLGFTDDFNMYTVIRNPQDRYAQGGTYLKLQEGNLYDSDGHFARSAQKKDQVDVIERVIRLSNDTDRFCDADTKPVQYIDGDPTLPNPVEVCCKRGNECWARDIEDPTDPTKMGHVSNAQCHSENIWFRTCMYEGDKEAEDMEDRYPKIYVRSRVADLRGRKWIIDTSKDRYIDFQAPAFPQEP